MQAIKTVIHFINKNAMLASTLVVLFIMFLTVSDVMGRYFLNKPIPGTFELTRIALAITVFISVGYSQIEKVNISITVLYDRLPVIVQKILGIFNALISITLFSLVFWQMLKYAGRLADAGQYTTVLRLPMHPWVLIAAAGTFLLCLALVWDLIEAIKKFFPQGDVTNE